MISKAKIKQIRLLEKKKYRDETRLFVAEGNKIVADMLPYFECEWLIAKPSWIESQETLPAKELFVAGEDDIRKASLMKNPQDVLAVFRYPSHRLEDIDPSVSLIIALDGIQDPGNLGTIIRLADWFGIEHIVCSMDTADGFGPKAVQASMGALTRVSIHYTNLEEFLSKPHVPLYGAFLDGTEIYKEHLSSNGVIIIGNEGNGIRPSVEKLVNNRLFIPPFPSTRQNPNSLNAAMATAIICAEFRRRQGFCQNA
ncbi:MAG: RNA methyltransferase [Tannerella sp.]|jgi:TrmH family RNA methyltransferase|nr:RNA methyltransferase [Tannerella sp.]